MEITSDIYLRGNAWKEATEKYKFMFEATNYMLYLLAVSIGILYDKRINDSDEIEGENEFKASVPRNVIQNRNNGKLEFMFQTAILSTSTETLTEDERLLLAFGEENKKEFNKIKFLTSFANYGVLKLVELIGETELETMENLNHFFMKTYEDRNFDINPVPDEYLIDIVENP